MSRTREHFKQTYFYLTLSLLHFSFPPVIYQNLSAWRTDRNVVESGARAGDVLGSHEQRSPRGAPGFAPAQHDAQSARGNAGLWLRAVGGVRNARVLWTGSHRYCFPNGPRVSVRGSTKPFPQRWDAHWLWERTKVFHILARVFLGDFHMANVHKYLQNGDVDFRLTNTAAGACFS